MTAPVPPTPKSSDEWVCERGLFADVCRACHPPAAGYLCGFRRDLIEITVPPAPSAPPKSDAERCGGCGEIVEETDGHDYAGHIWHEVCCYESGPCQPDPAPLKELRLYLRGLPDADLADLLGMAEGERMWRSLERDEQPEPESGDRDDPVNIIAYVLFADEDISAIEEAQCVIDQLAKRGYSIVAADDRSKS